MKKKLGIWMDHSEANLMAFNGEVKSLVTINNEFDHDDMEKALDKSESLMYNKRQQHQAAFYEKIGDEISSYEEVILFGPTDAKYELLNLLKADLHYEKIKVEAQAADKLTDNQKHAFVRAYFDK